MGIYLKSTSFQPIFVEIRDYGILQACGLSGDLWELSGALLLVENISGISFKY